MALVRAVSGCRTLRRLGTLAGDVGRAACFAESQMVRRLLEVSVRSLCEMSPTRVETKSLMESARLTSVRPDKEFTSSSSANELIEGASNGPAYQLNAVREAALDGEGLGRFSPNQLARFVFLMAKREDIFARKLVSSALALALEKEEQFELDALLQLAYAASQSCPDSTESVDLLGVLEVRCAGELSSLTDEGVLSLTACLATTKTFPGAFNHLEDIKKVLQARVSHFNPLSAFLTVAYLHLGGQNVKDLAKALKTILNGENALSDVAYRDLEKTCRTLLYDRKLAFMPLPVANYLAKRCATMPSGHVCQIFHYAVATGQVRKILQRD